MNGRAAIVLLSIALVMLLSATAIEIYQSPGLWKSICVGVLIGYLFAQLLLRLDRVRPGDRDRQLAPNGPGRSTAATADARMKRLIIGVIAIVWIAGWGFMLHFSRQGLGRSDVGYWQAKAAGDEAMALMYHQAQLFYHDWAQASVLLGIIVPLAILAAIGIYRRLGRSRYSSLQAKANFD
ncbi:MAG TPA: hypothetical protein VM346_09790 [Sphingomicrobium sp.]|nr:hypothetical protein [Sphingomicrobium sp.]